MPWLVLLVSIEFKINYYCDNIIMHKIHNYTYKMYRLWQKHNDSIAIAILRRGQRHSLLGRRGHSQAQHPMAALQDRPRLTRAHLVQHEHLRKHLLRRRRERQGKRARLVLYSIKSLSLFYFILFRSM